MCFFVSLSFTKYLWSLTLLQYFPPVPRQTAQITFAFCALLKRNCCVYIMLLHSRSPPNTRAHSCTTSFCCLQYANAPRRSSDSVMHLYKLQMCTNCDSLTNKWSENAFLWSHKYLQHLCLAVPVRDCNSDSILNGDWLMTFLFLNLFPSPFGNILLSLCFVKSWNTF